MATDDKPSAFHWNAGGWFGAQLGSTLWLLILGVLLLSKDALTASGCLAAFLLLNVWGVYLWRSRKRLSAYTGLQRFLLAASVLIAGVVWLVNARGLSQPPTQGELVSTYLPYWVVGVAPVLMLSFHFRERQASRSTAERSR